jgi:hypothetical protein
MIQLYLGPDLVSVMWNKERERTKSEKRAVGLHDLETKKKPVKDHRIGIK